MFDGGFDFSVIVDRWGLGFVDGTIGYLNV